MLGSGMCKAGIAGYDAPRAVSLPGSQAHDVRHHGGPKMFGIMAGVTQKKTPRAPRPCLVSGCGLRSTRFQLLRTAHFGTNSTLFLREGDARTVRTREPGLSTSHWDLVPTCSVPVTLEDHREIWSHLFGVQDYGLFWKMTSGKFPYSFLFRQWIHVTSVYEGFFGFRLQKTVESPQLQFIKVVDFPVVVQRLIPMVLLLSRPWFFDGSGGTGSARRRRERRLRSMLRHERMSVATALAESSHHSAQRQKTARAGREARVALHGHVREAPLPQGRVLRHVLGHLPVPALDVRVPQMVDQLPDIEQFFRALSPDPEQVIEVPKICSTIRSEMRFLEGDAVERCPEEKP